MWRHPYNVRYTVITLSIVPGGTYKMTGGDNIQKQNNRLCYDCKKLILKRIFEINKSIKILADFYYRIKHEENCIWNITIAIIAIFDESKHLMNENTNDWIKEKENFTNHDSNWSDPTMTNARMHSPPLWAKRKVLYHLRTTGK